MLLTQVHLLKILSLIHFDIDEEKPTPEKILKLPLNALKGMNEKEEVGLKESMGIQTIQDLFNCESSVTEIATKTNISENKIDRWVRMTELLRSLTSGRITTPKIVIVGLDNAGKTSVILTMKRITDKVPKETRLKEIQKLKPTKGVKRQEMVLQGQTMILFDMGGQEAYRQRYLKTPQDYLDGTNLVIFIQDILDEKRYSEANKYFEGLARVIYKLGLDPAFAVLFHKIDDKLPEDSKYWKVMEDQASLLRFILRDIWKDRPTPSLKTEMVFQTSVLRESSVFLAISDALKFVSPVQDILRGSAQEAAKTLDSDLLLLVSDNGLELARFQEKNVDYLKDEPLDFLFTKTLLKITEMQERSSVFPIQIGKKKLYHVITTTLINEKPIYLSYLSHVDAIPKQAQIEEILDDTFLPWVANYFEKM